MIYFSFRFSAGHDDVHSFSTDFLRDLLSHGACNMGGWAGARSISPFSSKLLLIPFSTSDHASLFVIVNVGLYLKNNQELSQKDERSCILHLDPRKNGSSHSSDEIGRLLLAWLNAVYRYEQGDKLDQNHNPFSCSGSRSIPIISPDGKYFIFYHLYYLVLQSNIDIWQYNLLQFLF